MKMFVILGIMAAFSCVLLADAQKSVTMTEEEMKTVDKFFRAKFEEAKSYCEARKYDAALKLIDAILILHPEVSFRQEVVSLRVKCEEGMIQQSVVRSYILVPKSVCEVGERVEFRIRVDNLSGDEVRIFSGGQERSILGRLEREVYEYALDGTSRISRAPVVVRNTADIVLRRGEGWEKSYFIDTEGLGSFEGKFRRYILRGVLRPAEMEFGGERFSRDLPLEPVTIDVLPEGCARYARSPVEVIRDSVMHLTQHSDETARSESEGQTMLFYASFYVPAESLDEVVGLIIGSLDKLSSLAARTAMGVLTNLTAEAHGFEVEEWKKWWARKVNKP
jgi:hypothetical protein